MGHGSTQKIYCSWCVEQLFCMKNYSCCKRKEDNLCLKCDNVLHLLLFYYSGIPIFLTSKGNKNWFEESRVKMQSLTKEEKWLLLRVIRSIKKIKGSRNQDSTVLCLRKHFTTFLLFERNMITDSVNSHKRASSVYFFLACNAKNERSR